MNLTAQDPEFTESYSFTEFYSMDSLNPLCVKELAEEIRRDQGVALKYLRKKYTEGPMTTYTCNASCRENIYCEMNNGNSAAIRKCCAVQPDLMERVLGLFLGEWTVKVPFNGNEIY